jgi:hypothetical protein
MSLRTSLVLWGVLFVAVGIKSLVSPEKHDYYPGVRSAGQTWLAGEDLYDQQINGIYRYGPVFAWAVVPLAVLPAPLGSLLWNWLNLGLFCATLWLFVGRGVPGDWDPRHKSLFLSLVLLGTVRTIWSGQCNMAIFALVALATLAIQEGRWWRAAFLLAIPVHIKVWPIAVALLLVAYLPRKLALRFPLAMLAVAALPFLTKPWGWVGWQYTRWYEALVGPAQLRAGHVYRDAWTLWELIQQPVNPRAYLVLQLLAAAAVFGLCLWQARRGLSLQRHLLFVLVVWAVWQMIFGPATERDTFGLIAPLSSWGLVTAFRERRGRGLMAVAFVLMIGASFGVIERAVMDRFPAVLAAHPVGAMLFLAWFLGWNRQPSAAASRGHACLACQPSVN